MQRRAAELSEGYDLLLNLSRALRLQCRRNLLPMLAMFLAVPCFTPAAGARPQFPAIVQETYHPHPGGTVDAAAKACFLCHVADGPPKLNPYGTDVRLALDAAHATVVTPAILHSIENKDSDGDGVSNGRELAADTLPGAASSKPAAGSAASTPAPPAGKDVASGPQRPWWLALMFPRHAQHPVFVHFPIGLFVFSFLLDLLAVFRRQTALAAASYLNLIAAAVGSVAAVISGLLAWQFAFGGAALTGTLLLHLVLSSVLTVLLFALWYIRRRQPGGPSAVPGPAYIALGAIAFGLLVVSGHLGGILSGVNGP